MTSNPPVLTQFALPDPNASPLSVTQLVQLLNVLISSEIQGAYAPYVLQSGTPDVRDQDKVWIEQDTQGRPVNIKTYWHGRWRRVYNGMLGEIRIYSGDPSIDFDSNGLGIVSGNYDGWHLCNGQDGVEDMSDRFVIGAHMNNNQLAGYQGGQWVTTEVNSGGEHSGGARDITLNAENTFQPAQPPVVVGKYLFPGGTGETLDSAGDIYGKPSLQDDTKNKTLLDGIDQTTPSIINIIPVYLAFAYIKFIGYAT